MANMKRRQDDIGVRAILKHELAYVVYIVATVVGFYNYVMIPIDDIKEAQLITSYDIELIKNNHLEHIQVELETNNKEHRELFIILERVEATLHEHNNQSR